MTAGLEAMMNRQSEKITALYCRLASFTEADILTAKNQMDRLAAYAAENGLQNPEFFCDWGFSGTNMERPEYQRMLHEVEAGRVNNLVVVSLCRLGRDYTASQWSHGYIPLWCYVRLRGRQ